METTLSHKPAVMDAPEDIALADKMNAGRKRVEQELAKLIVGQGDVVNQVLLTLFVGGNSLIVGVPGLAKTLLIQTLAQVVDLDSPDDIALADRMNAGRQQIVTEL